MDVFDLQAALRLDKSDYDEGLNAAKGSAKSMGSSISSALKTAAVVGTAAITAAATGVVALTKKAVESYATYEQLVGGVETLFGAQGKSLQEYAKDTGKSVDQVKDKYNTLMKAQETALSNANNAYKTAGMSANSYMEIITSFAASLKQSTENEVEAAKVADVAIQDMSDNASKMGTSMESIQNAYQGFAKQNYTMLDNLKLGYGGTKEEMQRLLKDAQELTGVKYDINNLSDVYNAIHVIQGDLGITGTTAKEAMFTIEGSANMTKAAWENVVTAIGSGEGLSEAMDNLVTAIFGDESGGGLLNNIIPRIQTVMEGIGDLVAQASPYISEKLPELIDALLPSLLTSAITMIEALIEALPGILESLWNAVVLAFGTLYEMILEQGPTFLTTVGTFLMNFLTGVTEKLPAILQAGMDMISQLVTGIIDSLPTLISGVQTLISNFLSIIMTNLPSILQQGMGMVSQLVTGILNNLPALITAVGTLIDEFLTYILKSLPDIMGKGFEMVSSIVEGIINNLPAIVEAIVQVISKLLTTITSNLPQVLQKGIEIIGKLIAGLITAIPDIVRSIPQIVQAIIDGFLNTNWLEVGVNIIQGIINGLFSAVGAVVDAIVNIAGQMLDGILNFFGIHSPSRVFRDQVGKMLMRGVSVGVEENDPSSDVLDVMGNVVNKAREAVNNVSLPINAYGNVELVPSSSDLIVKAEDEDDTSTITVVTNLIEFEFSRLMSMLSEYFPQFANTQLVMDSGVLVGEIAPVMDDALGAVTTRRGRNN